MLFRNNRGCYDREQQEGPGSYGLNLKYTKPETHFLIPLKLTFNYLIQQLKTVLVYLGQNDVRAFICH